MRWKHAEGGAAWAGLALAVVFSLAPFGQSSIDGAALPSDPCEVEATQAYAQALRLCQLADNPNPRLRCFEAAKAVYWQTLEECKRSGPRSSPVTSGDSGAYPGWQR